VIAHRAKGVLAPFHRSKGQCPKSEEFWALKDVSFEIKQGDRVGIIGRNGAGKSTLLKILSRITEPTHGKIRIKGRVASLLEVGTGFHPELTGRENIFLNGAILGMSKAEIQRKFDEIVAFAEVERFVDTPVKRYSSGMYVRLAFAVAAHLEPEVLIADEVLAVGDMEFQKKCLGKMEEVSTNQGRTILFVSHNMQAISRLTNRCVVLSAGQSIFNGVTNLATEIYRKGLSNQLNCSPYYQSRIKAEYSHLAEVKVRTSHDEGLHQCGHPLVFEFTLQVIEPSDNLCFSFQILDDAQQPICHLWFLNPATQEDHKLGTLKEGVVTLRCKIPKFRLYMGTYTLTTWLTDRRSQDLIEKLTDICQFEVTMEGIHREVYEWSPKACAYLEEALWNITQERALNPGHSIYY
jgi:lipopolysaccharide transport system ATP-binding protein